jgi:hypothetical protein
VVRFIKDATGPGRVIDRRGDKGYTHSGPVKGHPSMSAKPRKQYINRQVAAKKASTARANNPWPRGTGMNPIFPTGRGSRRRPTRSRKAR